MNNLDLDSLKSLKLPSINPDHLPVAYALMALGLLAIVKSPSKLVSMAGAYMLYRDIVARGKERLQSQLQNSQSGQQ